MDNTLSKTGHRPVIGFGPRLPDYGSWNWVGADTAESLSAQWDVRVFDQLAPECDIVVFVKFKPPTDVLRQIAERAAIVYCPIDVYGSAAEIDTDAQALRCCSAIVIHCERLRKYFLPYSRVEYIDHHIKFAPPLRHEYLAHGPILWIGVRSNLPPLIEYVNTHDLPNELWILTNFEDPQHPQSVSELGLRPDISVRMENWTPDRHLEWTRMCRAAIDVKAQDFRARHKPPAKAFDFLAAGVPIAIDSDSSTAEALSSLGFNVAGLDQPETWLSRDYWTRVTQFGANLHERLTKQAIANRFEQLFCSLLKS